MSAVITSAYTHDVTTAIETVDSIVIKRPSSKSTTKYRNNNNDNDKNKNKNKKNQNLCLDKAYHSQEVEQEIIELDSVHRFQYLIIFELRMILKDFEKIRL